MSIVAGPAFKGIALRCLSGNVEPPALLDSLIGQFALMQPSPTRSKAFPHRFAYRPSTQTHRLTVKGSRLTLQSRKRVLAGEPPSSLTGSPFAKMYRSRQCIQHTDSREVKVNNDFYVPTTQSDPPVDAFYFETSLNTVVLWVFQATIQRADGDVDSGFDLIADLLAKVRKSKRHRHSQVEVKYVLVAPHTYGRWELQWNMAPRWEEVQGEVYVQFVHATALASYCNPRNVIGLHGEAD
ncbi:hypothetical protein C8Q76DRAFT_741360 [Earliella scabrosa]|nr:hypothetical protein C8Q76DRAFT_741360 [Earliella scabrosa]